MPAKRESSLERFNRLQAFDREIDPQAWSEQRLAGVDEVGVGPLAGPVVAAAVILPHDFENLEINDSKKMTNDARIRCDLVIRQRALGVQVALCSSSRVDEINILQAMLEAQRQAMGQLNPRPLVVVVDGKRPPVVPPEWGMTVKTVIGGDRKSLCVAAASIIAKVWRDRLMMDLEQMYPGYGFALHKGYATSMHKQAIRDLGLSREHRLSFCGWIEAEKLQHRQASLAFD